MFENRIKVYEKTFLKEASWVCMQTKKKLELLVLRKFFANFAKNHGEQKYLFQFQAKLS